MAAFVQVGAHEINLDAVSEIIDHGTSMQVCFDRDKESHHVRDADQCFRLRAAIEQHRVRPFGLTPARPRPDREFAPPHVADAACAVPGACRPSGRDGVRAAVEAFLVRDDNEADLAEGGAA